LAEPLIHFAVPFAAFTALGVKPKSAFFLSLLALIPDLDILFHVHRSISHSMVPLLALTIPLLGLTWKNKSRRNIVFLALLAVTSHILLDLTGYTPILYPIVKDSYCINVNFHMHFGSAPNFALDLQLNSKPTIFRFIESFDAEIFTSQGLLISAVLLASSLFKALKSIEFFR